MVGVPASISRNRRPHQGFVEKTLAGISSSVEGAIFTQSNARRRGFLQARDARAKVIAFIVLVVAAGLSRHWEVLVPLYLLVLIGAATSKLDMRRFLVRIWLGIPLFSAIVVVPSIFFVGHHHLFHIPFGLFTLTVEQEGLKAAGIFVLRVGVSVSMAVLLVLTTPWAEILKSLRFFRVPNIFVLILAMTYRYIFLFLRTMDDMLLARKSRVVAHTSGKEQRWWIVSSIGVLMSRSFRMSDDVYQAMLARGFTGEFRTFDTAVARPADWLLAVGATAAAAVAIYVNGWVL